MKNKEVEIRLADLFAAPLKSVRFVLCFALIFALLGGAFGLRVAKNLKRTETGAFEVVEKDERAVELANTQLAAARRALERYDEVEIPSSQIKIDQAKSIVAQRRDYLERSLYQSIDPFNCGVSTLTFYIDAEQTVDPDSPWLVSDPRAAIAMACTQISAMDDEILAKVQSLVGTETEARFLKEIVAVSTVSDQFVKIQVVHEDAATAEKVVNYLYEKILERIGDSMGEFSARVISRYTGYDVDWTMNDRQNSNEDKLLEAEQALTEAEAARQTLLNEREQREDAAGKASRALEKAKRELRLTKLKAGQPVAVYGLIFLLGGLVLGAAAAAFGSLVSGRLQSQSSAQLRYAFPILGILPNGKRKLFARAIRRLEGDPETDFDSAARVAAQNILKLSEGKKVCLVSSLGGPAAELLAPSLGGRLAVCGDILRDPEASKTLDACEGAVLIERRGESRVDQIDGEVLRLEALGKEILGIVLL